MMLPENYLHYPERKYGMDHNLYEWKMLSNNPLVEFPDGKKIAFWVNICLQHFPLNSQGKPFKAPGSLTMPYPDLRHYTLRDYGNRVGVYRILEALKKYNVQASFAINGSVAERYPTLMQTIANTNSEIIAHGWDMDSLHFGGMAMEDEKLLIGKTLQQLQPCFNKKISGWLSPARSQSENTLALLAAEGLVYNCDWVNDEMPYNFKMDNGKMASMPLSYELEDVFIIMNNQHSEASYAQQIMDSFDFLYKESETTGGRILSLNIHPWMMGQPHRIKYLEQVFAHVMASPLMYNASPSEILGSCFI